MKTNSQEAARNSQARQLAESLNCASLILQQRAAQMVSLQSKGVQKRMQQLRNECFALALDALHPVIQSSLKNVCHPWCGNRKRDGLLCYCTKKCRDKAVRAKTNAAKEKAKLKKDISGGES